MSSFLDLPVEIILNTLSFVGPKDAVVLRRVSKKFNELCRLRQLWIEYLGQMCDAQDSSHSVYDTKNMNTAEIEDVVLQSPRFVAFLKDPETPASLPHSNIAGFLFLQAAPWCIDRSGRFVILQEGTRVVLIDLRATNEREQCIADLKYEGRKLFPCSVFTRGQGGDLDVMILVLNRPYGRIDVGEPGAEETLELHRFHVHPLQESLNPALVEELVLGSIKYCRPGPALPPLDVQGDLIAIYYQGETHVVILWDYMRSKIDIWALEHSTCPSSNSADCKHQPFIRGQDIYLGSSNGVINHWKIEPKSQFIPTSRGCIPDAKPKTRPAFSSLRTPIVELDREDAIYSFPYDTPYIGVTIPYSDMVAVHVYSVNQTGDGQVEYQKIVSVELKADRSLGSDIAPRATTFSEGDIVVWRRSHYKSTVDYTVIRNFRSWSSSTSVLDAPWTNIRQVLGQQRRLASSVSGPSAFWTSMTATPWMFTLEDLHIAQGTMDYSWALTGEGIL